MDQVSVTFVVPCLNEAENLEATIEEIRAAVVNGADYEIILIDDASTDQTLELMRRCAAADARIRVLHNPINLGMGGGYKRGLAEAKMSHVILIPGDNCWPASSIRSIIRHASDADLVLPYVVNSAQARPAARVMLSRFFTWLINTLFWLDIKYYNGAILGRSALLRTITITTNSHAFQLETSIKLIGRGASYTQCPVTIQDRIAGRSTALRLRNLVGVGKVILLLIGAVGLFRLGATARASKFAMAPGAAGPREQETHLKGLAAHPWLMILIGIFAAFCLWLINDALTNEDWIFVDWTKHRALDQIYFNNWYSNTRANIISMGLLPLVGSPIVMPRIFGVLAILVSAWAIRSIAIATNQVDPHEATLIAILSLVYPGDMMLLAPSLFSYVFYLAVFLAACAILMRDWTGWRAVVVEFLASTMLFLSFVVSSLLVFYGGFLLLHWRRYHRAIGRPDILRSAVRYCIRFPHLIALPPAYWVLRIILGQSFETRPGYNAFQIDIGVLFGSTKVFVAHTAYRLALIGIAILIAIAISIYLHRKGYGSTGSTSSVSGRSPWLLLAFGVLLFVLACMPYVLVGKAPGYVTADGIYVDYDRWFTRHLLLVQIAAAVLIAGIMRLLHNGAVRRSITLYFVGSAAIAACCVIRIEHCAMLQVEGAQDRALQVALANSAIAREASIYEFAANVSGYGYDEKPYYVWPYFLKAIYGGELSRYAIVVYSAPNPKIRFTPGFLAEQLGWVQSRESRFMGYVLPPPNAKQVSVTLSGAPSTPRIGVAAVYWWHRFVAPAGLQGFLDQLVTVDIVAKGNPAGGDDADFGSPRQTQPKG